MRKQKIKEKRKKDADTGQKVVRWQSKERVEEDKRKYKEMVMDKEYWQQEMRNTREID